MGLSAVIRWLIILTACVISLATGVVQARPGPDSNYNVAISGGGGFTGPGDVTAFMAWSGIGRCYSSTYAGSHLDITDAATGNTTGTRLQCSAGGVITALVSGSACATSSGLVAFVTTGVCSSLATTCAVACVILTAYDETGNTNCTGKPCDLVAGTLAVRPTYVASATGRSRAAAQFNSASGQDMCSLDPFGGTLTQPYSVSYYGERTGNTGNFNTAWAQGIATAFNGWNNAANQVTIYDGTLPTPATANDNAFHAVQNVHNGASSVIYVDGASNSPGSSGAGTLSNSSTVCIGGAGGNNLTGFIAEAGVATGAFSGGTQSSLNSNQTNFY